MINIHNQNRNVYFQGKSSLPKVVLPVLAFFCSTSLMPANSDEFIKNSDNTEVVTDAVSYYSKLQKIDSKNLVAPVVNIAGKERQVGIVVDTECNQLYRYNSDGDLIDGYYVATGRIGRNGKSITDKGIRVVDHIENAPYEKAYGSKRKRMPKAFGPHVLYLEIIDPKTGRNLGSNGEFIHGNNDEESVRKHKYASNGCIRMENEVIKKFAKEVKKGTIVLIR